jgi:hypothetical protein
LGLRLPSYDFWSLLQGELPQALDQAKGEVKAKAKSVVTAEAQANDTARAA